jgi:hypothetical protein
MYFVLKCAFRLSSDVLRDSLTMLIYCRQLLGAIHTGLYEVKNGILTKLRIFSNIALNRNSSAVNEAGKLIDESRIIAD